MYLAETQLVAMLEVQALFGLPTSPGGLIANPRLPWTVVNVATRLSAIADLTIITAHTVIDTTAQELTGDWLFYDQRLPVDSAPQPTGIAPTQALADALYAVPDLEGFLAVSARLPNAMTLVIFPQKLHPPSSLQFLDPATGRTTAIPSVT